MEHKKPKPKPTQRGSQRGSQGKNPKAWPKTKQRARTEQRTNPELRQKSFQKSKTEQRANSEVRQKSFQKARTEQSKDSKTNPILKRTKRIKNELAVLGYHALLEALNQGHALKYVSISDNTETQKRRDLIDLCHKKKVSVMLLSKTEMEKNYPGLMHRGFLGELKSTIESISSLEDFLNNQTEKNCVVVALDGISDQQNLGAMIRSCYFFNVSLMVSEIRNSAPIDHMTHRSSAGASLRQPFHWANKLSQALQMFKDKNFTIIGAVTERHPNAQPYQLLKLEKPTVLIVGNEESGLRPHVLRFCNQLTTIQRKNNFDSLNVSVSLGILLAHLNK